MCFIPYILISALNTDDVIIAVIVTIRCRRLLLGNAGRHIRHLSPIKALFQAIPQVHVALKHLKAQAVICLN